MYIAVDVEKQAPAIADVPKVTDEHPKEPKLPFLLSLLVFVLLHVLAALIFYAITGQLYDPCEMEPSITWDDVMKAVHWGQHTLEWAYAALNSEIQSVW